MSRFQAPYKATLIRLYKLYLIDEKTLETYFDKTIDYHREFEALGLDPYMIERSNVVNFGKLEKLMNQYTLPYTAQQANQQVLEEVIGYFHKMKGEAAE
ncbi:hypothetical protein CN326_17485 [Bacillus sp. AFS018417]|uniref:hypothetical protein n=1 Tax=Bacillus sp. AFS018417 TaxID=2033491 RepID=UPI000BF894D9|nr:hypothetical protein [Bacillus sp. AFS018417]PEZ03677.1 hypothetical protein CN326_17485 [Bacillus sp. AFS018417]